MMGKHGWFYYAYRITCGILIIFSVFETHADHLWFTPVYFFIGAGGTLLIIDAITTYLEQEGDEE